MLFCFDCIGLRVFDCCFVFVLLSLVVDCFVFLFVFLFFFFSFFTGVGVILDTFSSVIDCVYIMFLYTTFYPLFLLMLILLYPHYACRDWYECASECT